LEGASPHLVSENHDLFFSTVRADLSTYEVVEARTATDARSPLGIRPEQCLPYVAASTAGWQLLNIMPLVFVRAANGDLLPDSRTALKYLRENADIFRKELQTISSYAERVFQPDLYAARVKLYPELF
jgi:hypothetical protein